MQKGDLICTTKGTSIEWYVITKTDELKGVQVDIVKNEKNILTFKAKGKPKKLDKANCTIYKRADLLKELKTAKEVKWKT